MNNAITIKHGGFTMPVELAAFARQADKLKFIAENFSTIKAEKMHTKHGRFHQKETDGFDFNGQLYVSESGALKAVTKSESETYFQQKQGIIKPVINTTNWMDSHHDVHIPKLWNKTVKDAGGRGLHLQEHDMAFDKVCGDEATVKCYVQKMQWRELGIKMDGETEALFHEFSYADIYTRNPYMADQYAKGYVKQHSVGMRYVTLFMCMNSEERWAAEYYENWEKYFPMVANQAAADEEGFFWAVTEARKIEGSAVVRGSNPITPTMEILSDSTKNQPDVSTGDEPEQKDEFLKWLGTKNLIN